MEIFEVSVAAGRERAMTFPRHGLMGERLNDGIRYLPDWSKQIISVSVEATIGEMAKLWIFPFIIGEVDESERRKFTFMLDKESLAIIEREKMVNEKQLKFLARLFDEDDLCCCEECSDALDLESHNPTLPRC